MRWNVSDLQLPGSVEIKKGHLNALKRSAGHKVSNLQYMRNNETVTAQSKLFYSESVTAVHTALTTVHLP